MAKKTDKSNGKKKSIPSLIDFMTANIKKDPQAKQLLTSMAAITPDYPGILIPSPQFRHVLANTHGKIPYGSILEVIGWESVGKTSLGWHILIAELFQCLMSIGHYNDAERAGFGYKLADDFNVDRKRCWITQPPDGESAFAATYKFLNIIKEYRLLDEIKKLAEKDKPHAVGILDSVSALLPSILLNTDPTNKKKAQKAALAALMSEECPKVKSLVSDTQSIIIFVNQYRTGFDIKTGNSWLEPTGGKALRFWADYRFTIKKVSVEKYQEEEVGMKLKITCIKNKLSKPLEVANVIFGWGNGPYALGIDVFSDLFEECKNRKVIVCPKGQSWSKIFPDTPQEIKFQGVIGFKKKLLESKQLMDDLIGMVELKEYSKLFSDKYDLMKKRRQQIEGIEASEIISEEAVDPVMQVETVKQGDDGGFDINDMEQMQKDADDIKKDLGNNEKS